MLILVEGSDGAGKTWLGELFAKKLRQTYILKQGFRPRGNNPEEIMELKASYGTMLDIYLRQILPAKKHMVFDRYYPSEIAYSAVMRGYDASLDIWYKRLEAKLLTLDHMLWYVHAPLDQIEARFKARGEDFVNMDQVAAVVERYEEFLANTKLNVMKIKSGGDEAKIWIDQMNGRS
jgi:thymidylate kinase